VVKLVVKNFHDEKVVEHAITDGFVDFIKVKLIVWMEVLDASYRIVFEINAILKQVSAQNVSVI